ncbi:MAG: helix-turn-helix transcriptional regulator [Acidimicrobiia bacterium]|nr:MAG: helix-turn-helix transcriptional regulator [Acidimicrobiia bacterium]
MALLAIASRVPYSASTVKNRGVREVGGFIREQRERSAMSLRKLADKAGISNPYLSQIERGLRRPSADILVSIAGALGLRAEHLFERAGLLDHTEHPDIVGAIEEDEALTVGQKQAMTEIYNSFVIGNNGQEKS